VLLGKGNGTFQPAVNYSISKDPQVANFPKFVTVGRLRNNGPLDIVTTNFGTSNVTVLLGNGDGTFGAPIHVNAGAGNEAAAIADFNDDGTPDILVTNNSTDTVILLPGNGDGTFRAPVQFATPSRATEGYHRGQGRKGIQAGAVTSSAPAPAGVSGATPSTVDTSRMTGMPGWRRRWSPWKSSSAWP
jgi:hypothetical protein